jgi:hypothetical protein
MGFHDEANLPEEYYCELCKPKLHKIQKTPDGYVEENLTGNHMLTCDQQTLPLHPSQARAAKARILEILLPLLQRCTKEREEGSGREHEKAGHHEQPRRRLRR